MQIAPASDSPVSHCPRCRGAMLLEKDWYGAYSTCLACGYVRESGVTATLELQAEVNDGQRQRRRQPSHGKLRL